jgi:tRNA(Ile)-lysidine synthase
MISTANAFASLLRQAPPGARPVLRGLTAAQSRRHLFPTPSGSQARSPVVVAVSGGADSLCLLHALHLCRELFQLALHVAHLDHSLRPESAEDAGFVAQQAAALGLPVHAARLAPGQLADRAEGLEAAARQARYAFLSAVAHDVAGTVAELDAPAVTVATAHHMDDQAETVLMNFLRGSGPAGLAGIAWSGPLPHNDGPPVRLVRPLLGVTRAETLAYLAAYDLAWREDATNQEQGYLRNRLRHDLLPRIIDELKEVNPSLIQTLARTADLFAAETARATRLDHAALEAVQVEAGAPLRIVLDLARLLALDLATRRGVVRLALDRLGVDLRAAGLEAVDRVLDAISGSPHASGPRPLVGEVAWTVLGATGDAPYRLSLHRHDALPIRANHPHLAALGAPFETRLPLPIPPEGALELDGWRLTSMLCPVDSLSPGWNSRAHPWCAHLDADQARHLLLAAARPGLQIAPLGLHGRQRTVGDLFTDHKTPVALRPGWPLVLEAESGQVVWLCGLAVAHPARITAQTRRVRTLAWTPAAGQAHENG